MLSSDPLGAYLRIISQFPLLSAEEEQETARCIELGREAEAKLEANSDSAVFPMLAETCSEGKQARTRFINSNLRLVVMLSRRHTTGELDLIDVIQLGNIGLIRAVDKFDWRRGFRFSTHAAWWIRQSIGVGIEQTAGIIRIPRTAREELNLLQAASKHASKSDSLNDIEVVARWTGMEPDRVRRVMSYPQEITSMDADTRLGHKLQDLIPSTPFDPLDDLVEITATSEVVQQSVEKLTPLEREIVLRKYGLQEFRQHSLKDIAIALNLTVTAVSRILNDATNALKIQLEKTFNEC